jgi:hypothetical protein
MEGQRPRVHGNARQRARQKSFFLKHSRSAEETVVAIARFMARLAIAATRREDKDTGILYQELLAGKGPDHMRAGASALRDAVRIKVQDNKVGKH